ncbi:hypothetical protein BO78DRAFT_19599 [Aspergillus sclerotiicarbonarius CBS 121057]|uniref:Uncharacterized protein n=1 Tax=Aspergillus sclerotiicarbonarius (strain CBS 121057 / IBT 28362) TaxID=1448318 RepID=A0A319DVB5_ASPSB|nr:hypothetical protein BO78DRAFT_19599 [Aspergillus sclerotiicarbonarius CBS 121057]
MESRSEHSRHEGGQKAPQNTKDLDDVANRSDAEETGRLPSVLACPRRRYRIHESDDDLEGEGEVDHSKPDNAETSADDLDHIIDEGLNVDANEGGDDEYIHGPDNRKDAICTCCNRLESQIHTMERYRNLTNIYHRIHVLLPGKLLCLACWEFFGDNKRLRTPEEVQKFLNTVYLKEARLAGEGIICDHCKVVEGSPVCNDKKHRTNRELSQVLCYKCDLYYKDHNEHCSPNIIRSRQARIELQAAREAGRLVQCSNCYTVEGDSLLANKKKFHVNFKGDIMCPPCSTYYSEHVKQRDQQTMRHSNKRRLLKDSRQSDRQIICERCRVAESSSSCPSKHGVSRETGQILCQRCRVKVRQYDD